MSDNPTFATKVKVGNKEYLLKDLIAECRIEPTENGKIYVHPDHGKNELQENLDFARWRAEMFGEEVVLLPNPQNVKSADSYNITRGVNEEYKRTKKPSINAVSQEIRYGKDQADYLIIEPHPDMKAEDMMKAFTSRVTNGNPPRCVNLREIRLKIGEYEAVYSREQIIADGFKIKPEDFHSVSASRSQGTSHTSQEAGSITDAKLEKFFGLNKKSAQEIAAERHAKRDPEAIQKKWNERRIANIQKSVAKGLLPKECVEGLAILSQEEFNSRIEFLQKRAAQHAARTPEEIQRIQKAWNERRMARESNNADKDRKAVAEALGIKPGNPMSFEEANEMRGNPNYKKGVKFRTNCQSSVLANEMRRRGFDVEAYGNTKQDWHMPSVLAKKPEIAFMDASGELPVPKGIRFNGDLLSSLEGEMKETGRYHLRFRFANDGGHIITAERLPDGSLRIYDPQSGKIIKDFSEYAVKVKPDSFEYYRVDNLQINPDVAKGAVKLSKTKGDAPRMQFPEIQNFLEKGWYGEIKEDVAEYVKQRNKAIANRDKVALDMDLIKNGGFIRSDHHSRAKGSIFATEELPKKISKEDLELSKNIQMAKKMADNGFDVYLLSNPHSTKSADFIFTKGGKAYYTEGKLSTGKNSLGHNLAKGSSQSDRILIDLTGTKDTNYISARLEEAFEQNSSLSEVMLLKGGRLISVKTGDVANKDFKNKFKRIWEKRK